MKNHRKILVLLLSVMMVFTLMPSAAFAGIGDGGAAYDPRGTEPAYELDGGTIWLGTEYFQSPHINDVDMAAVEVISITSDNPGVLAILVVGDDTTVAWNYLLDPRSTGVANITVEFRMDGQEYTAQGEYTVKNFPIFVTDLTIDGELVSTENYYYHNYYDISGYEGTLPSIGFSMAEGWSFVRVYGNKFGESGNAGIDMEYEFQENGWTFDFPEEYTELDVFFGFVNGEGEEIELGVRLSRGGSGGNDPADGPELPDGAVSISDEGILSWTPVDGAAQYYLSINNYGWWLYEESNGSFNVNETIDTLIKNDVDFVKPADDNYKMLFKAIDDNYNSLGWKEWQYHYETEAEYVEPELLEFTIEDGIIHAEMEGYEECSFRVTIETGYGTTSWEVGGPVLEFDINKEICELAEYGRIDTSTGVYHIMVEALVNNVIVARGETDHEFSVPEVEVLTEEGVWINADGTLEWNEITGAEQYSVMINDRVYELDLSDSGEYNINDKIDWLIRHGGIPKSGQDKYSLTFKARSKEGYLLAKRFWLYQYATEAAYQEPEKLDLVINGCVLETEYPGTEQFAITISLDDEYETWYVEGETISFDIENAIINFLSLDEDGSYHVSVDALADGLTLASGETDYELSIDVLTDEDVWINADGTLEWNEIGGAKEYWVEFGGWNYELVMSESGEFNVNELIDRQIKNGDIDKPEDDIYSIRFTVNDKDHRLLAYRDWSYLYETEAEYVEPGLLELTISNGILSAEYEGAEEYEISVFYGRDGCESWFAYGEELAFDIDEMITTMFQSGSIDPSETLHHIRVAAKADHITIAVGETDYEFAMPEISAITGLALDESTGILSWDPVEGAETYNIIISEADFYTYDPEINIYDAIDEGISNREIIPAEDDLYSMTVNGLSPREAILAQGAYEVEYEAKATPPVEMTASISSGVLSWEALEGADRYEIKIDYNSHETTDLSVDIEHLMDLYYTRGWLEEGPEHSVSITAYNERSWKIGEWESTYEYTPKLIDEIELDTIEIADINTNLVTGEKPEFTARLLTEHMYIDDERWMNDNKLLSRWSDEVPEEGEEFHYAMSVAADEGYKFAEDVTVIYNGEEINADVSGEDHYYINITGIVAPAVATSKPRVVSIEFDAVPRLRKGQDAALSATAFDGDAVTLNYSDGTSEKYIMDTDNWELISETTGTVTEESSRIVISYDDERHVDFAAYYNNDIRLRAEDPGASYVAQSMELESSEEMFLTRGLDSVVKTDAQGNEYDEYSLDRLGNFDQYLEDDTFAVTYKNSLGETINVDYVYDESTGGFTLEEDDPYYTGYPSDNYFGTYFSAELPDQSVNHLEVGHAYNLDVTYKEGDMAPLRNSGTAYTIYIREAGPEDITSINFAGGSGESRIAIDDTLQLRISWMPHYANVPAEAIEWTSSDPSVAVVDENGLVTAVSEGSATITVKIGSTTANKSIEVYDDMVFTDDRVSLSQTVFPYTGNIVSIDGYVLYRGEPVPRTYCSFNYTAIGAEGQPPREIGDYKAVITGSYGGYSGTATEYFTIKGDLSKNATNVEVTLDSEKYTYQGYPVQPEIVSVTAMGKGGVVANLREGVDYTVSYEDNDSVGTGYVIITAAEDSYYIGEKRVPFTITEATSPEIELTVEDGVLTWPLVDGAADYGVMIAGSGWWTDWREEDGNTGAFNVNTRIDELIKNGAIQKPEDGNYVLTVAAFTENMEEEITRGTLTYHYESSAEHIEPVDIELSVENGMLTWTPVDGAVRYMILVDFGEKWVAGRVNAEDFGPFDIDAAIEKGISDGWLVERPDGNYTLIVNAVNDDGQVLGEGSMPYHYEKPAPEPGWRQDENGVWYYYYEDGTIAKNEWLKDQDGDWCYVGADGKKVTNAWKKDSRGWCYLGADGKMVKNTWKKDSTGWCYLGSDGYMVTNGWAKDSKGYCWMGSDGYMVEKTQWLRIGSDWYHITNGYRDQNKWMKDSKGWCYLGSDGKMVTNGWAKDSKGYCWMGSDGYMVEQTKWIKYDGEWYYIKSGYMATDCWAKDGNYWAYLGSDGKMVKNTWKKDSKGWCYLGSDGHMVTNGWAKDSKGYCWMGSDGYMVEKTQWIKYDGGWYYIEKGYRVENKWKKDSKGWCYLGADGRMVTNDWAPDTKGMCWIGPDGYMVEETMLLEYNGQTYGIEKGYMVVNGSIIVDGVEYFFDENGILILNP